MACGGTVEGTDGARANGEMPNGDDDGMPSGGTRDDGSDASDAGDLALEECELGFLPNEATEPCNWLGDDRCYETKAKACDCLCPRDTASVCSSDFYGGEGSRTKVRCR